MAAEKQIALITGGFSGIGLAAACQLAERGVSIAAVSSGADHPDKAQTKNLIETLTALHDAKALFLSIDIREAKSIAKGVDAIAKTLGEVTILINAAGTYHHEAIADHSLDGWADTIAVNLSGPFLMTRACWPMMQKAQHGRIINIASTAAHRGMQEYAGYCSAKAGLLRLTQVTALEGAPYNITCNSISPSWVDTPMMAQSLRQQAKARGVDVASLYDEARRDSPQSRIISADEIARQITWLALEAPLALTGEDILMTGGASW